MSIHFQILGRPGRDNVVFIRLDAGNKLYRILFDCGEYTLSNLPQSEVKALNFLLFSHLHMDHIAGFDYFFRRTFDRNMEPVSIFGPEETSSIIHNRFMGFKWNLTEGLAGGYLVTDIKTDQTSTYWYEARSGFSERVPVENHSYSGTVLANDHFIIRAVHLNHRITSLAYRIQETDSVNIDKEALLNIGLEPGPWLNKLKDLSIPDSETISSEGKTFRLDYLRDRLIKTSRGDSICYLTDFINDSASQRSAVELCKNADVIICESQYLREDEMLAAQNYHLTSTQAAAIALEAGVKKLILFHISERYIHDESKMNQMLAEARQIFPETYFPEHWVI